MQYMSELGRYWLWLWLSDSHSEIWNEMTKRFFNKRHLKLSPKNFDQLVLGPLLCVISCEGAHQKISWWRHQVETFSALQAICVVNSPVWPVNSPHKGPWRGALMFSLICPWINSWVNNREAGDLRRQLVHYNVTVMLAINGTAHPPMVSHTPTSNGSWRQGIKGEMTCTGYVALVWNIIYRIMTIVIIIIIIIIILIMIITIMIIIIIIIIIIIRWWWW